MIRTTKHLVCNFYRIRCHVALNYPKSYLANVPIVARWWASAHLCHRTEKFFEKKASGSCQTPQKKCVAT
jgi:hypothetical protein